jgi:hypothetical protein
VPQSLSTYPQTLQSYINTLRYHLEDANGTFWTDNQLTTSINMARDRVVYDTLCCRTLQFITLTQGQQQYQTSLVLTAAQNLPNPPALRAIGEILTINLQWSIAYQPPLRRLAWEDFNAFCRVNPTLQTQPVAWAKYGQNQFFIGPPPAQNYQCEVDATWLPQLLQQYGDIESAIPEPFTNLVPLKSAFWSYFYKNDAEKAQYFDSLYQLELNQMAAATPPWQVEDMYRS